MIGNIQNLNINPEQSEYRIDPALADVKKVENEQKATEVGQSESTNNVRECQTCKNRKYRDGSNEMVSFKSAASINPNAAASRVRAHEQEHVSNAYKKAAQNSNAKVIQASVTLKTAICPERGRSYISGGETNTKIQYSNEDQPYQKNLKEMQKNATTGGNIDVKK